MSRTATYVIAGLAAVLIIVLVIVFVIVLGDTLSSAGEEPTLAPTAVVQIPTATPVGELPPAMVNVPATFTPLPTLPATDTPVPTTPEPTETPSPTNTLPPPTPTNTPVPIVLPTNTPRPAPTNTPVPTPRPPDARGLVLTHFALQPRSVYSVGQQVWFEFTIVNNSGGEVAYNRLGVMPKKDGTDRIAWFQQSYGGPNASIKPQGLTHEDNIRLPEAGNYTLRLAICFDGYDACNSGGGTWVTLSQEIPVTIN